MIHEFLWPLAVQTEESLDPAVISTVQRYAWLLIAATLLGMVARRLRVPYAVALVIGGLLIEASHLGSVPHLEPDVLLFVFLPPLLFDAAFRLEAGEARSLIRPVLVLAVPGVFVTALLVGTVLWWVLDLSFPTALLFGSIVAATDPVAVIGMFQQLKVAKHLSLTAELESLVNDGMAITLYVVLLEWAVGGSFDLFSSLSTFVLEVGGGLVIGGLLGFLGSRLTRFSDDHLVEMLLSVSLAFGSYLSADSIGASGALACVAAGVIHGSYGRSIGMSENTRALLDDLWEFLGFVANAIVFLLLGVTVHLTELIDESWPIIVAVIAVLGARAFVTNVSGVFPLRRKHPVRTWQEAALLTWGGLRGALTAALALALPENLPHRDVVVAMAFGVVLFTLVVQGLTLPLLIRRLNLGRS